MQYLTALKTDGKWHMLRESESEEELRILKYLMEKSPKSLGIEEIRLAEGREIRNLGVIGWTDDVLFIS